MQVKQPPKTNLQSQNQSQNNIQGMKTFLTPSPNPSTETKPPQNNKKFEYEEVEKVVEQLEQKLSNNIKVLDLTSFNELIHKKHLTFKVLFIRAKIYTLVRDNTSGKTAIVSILPPRWGGSSLRFMLANCVDEFCAVAERNTKKGTILTYQQLGKTNSQEDTDIDDIFD